MKKNNNKFLWIGVLAIVTGGLWWWNNERIKSLKLQLEAARQNPPPPSNRASWISIVDTILSLGLNVYDQFSKGGQLEGKLDQKTIDEILRTLGVIQLKP